MKYLVLFLLTSFLAGCSTIISGTTQTISINSNVQGAEVLIDGQTLGRTPVINARVKRKDTMFLSVKKEGYKDFQQTLQTRFDNWFWGNIILGGVVGSTTDLASGTTHLLDPNSIFVQMEPVSGSSLNGSNNSAKTSEVRTFVTNSYSNLVKDIQSGSGDYLKSLFKLLSVQVDEQPKMLKKLKSLSIAYDTVHEFAEAVAKLSEKSSK